MNIDICNKCMCRKSSDCEIKIDGIALYLNFDRTTLFLLTGNKSFACYKDYQTNELPKKILLEYMNGKDSFMFIHENEIKKLFNELNSWVECPYHMEHQIYDWNKNES